MDLIPTLWITEVDLEFNPARDVDDATYGIVEDVHQGTSVFNPVLAQLEVDCAIAGIPCTTEDVETLNPQGIGISDLVLIQKDLAIDHRNHDPNEPDTHEATVSIISQSYRQAKVPEPSSILGLLAVGGLGLGLKRKKNQG